MSLYISNKEKISYMDLNFLKSTKSKKIIIIYFLFLLLFTLFISEITKKTLELDKLFYDSLATKYTLNQILEFSKLEKKWSIYNVFFVFVFISVKNLLITTSIYIGTLFYSKIKVSFVELISVVVKAELAFMVVGVVKFIWFYFFKSSYTFDDFQYFFPLSALNIIGYKGIDPWFIYPLQILNLFEVAYWFILAYYIGKIASPTAKLETNKYPIDFGLKIVASSYGSALLLWVVLVMFFTLNYS
jgi:hypothetical protein